MKRRVNPFLGRHDAMGHHAAATRHRLLHALSGTLLAEKRTRGGRLFYDFSGAAEQRLSPRFSAFVGLHRYENFGEFDARPTRKFEYEAGVNYLLDKRFNAALSYFRHRQDDDPNDRFAFVKLKLGYNF